MGHGIKATNRGDAIRRNTRRVGEIAAAVETIADRTEEAVKALDERLRQLRGEHHELERRVVDLRRRLDRHERTIPERIRDWIAVKRLERRERRDGPGTATAEER